MHIHHDVAGRRFVARLPSGEAVLAYAEAGPGVVDFYNTFVPPAGRGHGIAAQLVRAGLAYVRAEGLRVAPSCWYVRRWLDTHPTEQDLRAS